MSRVAPGTVKPATTVGLDSLLLADAFYADPYTVYARLRDEGSVHWSPALDAWLVSHHAEALAVLRDPARYSSFGWELRYLDRLPPQVRAEIPELLLHHGTPNIITADPPLHTRLRRSVMRGFTPRALEPLRQRLTELSHALLGARPEPRVARRGGGARLSSARHGHRRPPRRTGRRP